MAKGLRDEDEIEEQMYDAEDWNEKGRTAVPGMTYEDGVANALRWALGLSDDEPIETKIEKDEDDEPDTE